jgi:signal transduction histidine kinase
MEEPGVTGDGGSGAHDGVHALDGIAIVSAVGHELRSPLTSIRGYTSLLLNRWDRIGDDDKKLMLGQISHDAERVTRLINELLDISRIETGRLHLARKSVDVAETVRSVLASVTLAHPELDANVDVAPGTPEVDADSDKVEQVLTNLVENAVKYGSPEGLRIEVCPIDGVEVAITVRDRGPGIAGDDLDHVFERWFQREQGRPTGTGLGLWISKGIVEAHGGTLTVESREGEGAAFTFTLPVVSSLA